MSVRCFASSEPRTPPSNLGQEDKLLLNGQHQLHRGEDGPFPGQHHHKEGEEQARHGELLHLQRQENDIPGLLHHHQWEDQDRPGQCLLQQRHHHHLVSESLLSEAQDALDERGAHCGVGGLAEHVTRKRHHHREHTDTTTAAEQGLFQLRGKTGLNLLLEPLTCCDHAGFIKNTGQWLSDNVFCKVAKSGFKCRVELMRVRLGRAPASMCSTPSLPRKTPLGWWCQFNSKQEYCVLEQMLLWHDLLSGICSENKLCL